MNYMKIDPCSIANGDGVRVALFVAGCNIHCPNCHNQQAWPFDAGQPFTEKTMDELLQLLDKPFIKGLSVLGGEPLDPANVGEVFEICKTVKEKLPEKDIWLYTGYSLLSSKTGIDENGRFYPILQYTDVIVDGPFIQAEYDPSLTFKGSRNQRVWKRGANREWGVAG